MERHDRERRKEEERLLRERQREEERYQREQRRELERREKFLRKESIRVCQIFLPIYSVLLSENKCCLCCSFLQAEKLRQKEELRREKEAARIRAANERAIARRMARESMELIEDEHLELMELATSKKGLSSILALDYETMQNLELYAGE